MRLLPHLSLYFVLGGLCNIAAYESPHNFGWYTFTAASILWFYCFFSRLLYIGE